MDAADQLVRLLPGKRPAGAGAGALPGASGLPPHRLGQGCLRHRRRIGWGKGVCGTAAAQKATQLVPDVHAFPGHIACDGGSRSEVVVPILAPDGRVLGVIDLDSYQPAAFSQEDAAALEQVAALLAAGCDWTQD